MGKDLKGKEPKKVRALTIDEHKKFLEIAKNSSNYNQFAFLLQTGLRTGEINIGITMNLYVDVTEDEKVKEVDMVAKALKVV